MRLAAKRGAECRGTKARTATSANSIAAREGFPDRGEKSVMRSNANAQAGSQEGLKSGIQAATVAGASAGSGLSGPSCVAGRIARAASLWFGRLLPGRLWSQGSGAGRPLPGRIWTGALRAGTFLGTLAAGALRGRLAGGRSGRRSCPGSCSGSCSGACAGRVQAPSAQPGAVQPQVQAGRVQARSAGVAAGRLMRRAGRAAGRLGKRLFPKAFGAGAVLALLAGMPSRASAAAASLGDMSDSLKSEFAKFGPMLKAGFALAGFFLVGLGLWQLYALSQQPGRPKAGAIMAIVVGACLLGCATIAQMTSGSLGAGDPELSSIGL